MAVLTLSGKPIDWAKPPKPTTRVLWSKRDIYGRQVTGSLRLIAHLDHTYELAVKKFGAGVVVIQRAYNKGVKASAGTHDYDMCLDVYIPGVPWSEQQKFFRANGWGAYWRKAPLFSNHIHMFSLPEREGSNRSDDYRQGGFKVGYLVDGGWALYGKVVGSSQLASYYAHRVALANDVYDSSWFPPNIEKTIFNLPGYIAKRKPPILPTSGLQFLNVKGGDDPGKKTFPYRAPALAKILAAGDRPVVFGVELPKTENSAGQSPFSLLVKEMKRYDYRLIAYGASAFAFGKKGVVIAGPVRNQKLKTQYKGRDEYALHVIYGIRGNTSRKGAWFTTTVHHADVYANDSHRKKAMAEVRRGNKAFAKKHKKPNGNRLIVTDHNTKSGAMVTYMRKYLWKVAAKSSRCAIFVRSTMPVFRSWVHEAPSDHPILGAVLGRKG